MTARKRALKKAKLRHAEYYDFQAVQDGLYRCILCGQCTEVCDSAEIDHLTYWNDLRAAAEERNLKPRWAK